VQISPLSQTSISPLTPLTINGSGFDPANAAISVLLVSEEWNPPVTVPAFASTDTTIQIMMPPLPLAGMLQGTFAGDVVDVQVIQVDGGTISTSNVVTGLVVNALPAVPSDVVAGAITLAFLEGSLNVSSSLQEDATTDSSLSTLATNLTQYNADTNALISDTSFLMNNPGLNVAITTSNGMTTALDQSTLALSDQLILAYLTQFAAQVGTASSDANLTPRRGKLASPRTKPDQESTACPPTLTGDPATNQLICSFQQDAQTQAVVGGRAVQLAFKFLYGVYAGFLGGFAADAAAIAGAAPEVVQALQIAWGAAGSYVAAWGTASKSPTPCDLIASAGAQAFDDEALDGVPLMSPTLDAYNLYKDASEIQNPPPEPPCAGPLLIAPQTNAPSGTTAVNDYQTMNGTTTETMLAAPYTQQSEPTSAAVIPPAEVTTYTLTAGVGSGDGSVESFPEGISCGNTTCTASFPAGTTVKVTARPTAGESLTGWSGACSGIGTCVVTMNSNESVTANFGPGQTYSGTFAAPFSGTASDPCGDVYAASANGTITLNVVENSGGTVTGSASVPTYIGISVVSCLPGNTCTPLPFSETAAGSVSGNVGSLGGTFISQDQVFTLAFTGSQSGNSITGSATFSATFKGTGCGTSNSTTLSGSVSSVTLNEE
jgi:hypothetical protein